MFTKLFSSITTSSIWNEDNNTRIVWVTMLAMSNKEGYVSASMGGLAHEARVSREDCESALKVLTSPDEDSRSKEFEGRRVEIVDGGFQLLNHPKYRAMRSEEERKEYMKTYMVEYRARTKNVNKNVNNVSECKPPLAKAEAEADTDTEAEKSIYSGEFEIFWASYPKKTGKGGAWNSFRKLKVNSEMVKKMVGAVAAQSDSEQWKSEGGKYIPNPQTWLNQRRWEDEGLVIKKQSLKDEWENFNKDKF